MDAYACITPQAYAGNASTYLTAQWFRTRLYPPNGVMPTLAISEPISTAASNLVLYVIIIVAALIVLAIVGFLTLRRGEGRHAIPSTKQKVVNIDDVENYIAQGWEYVANLPNDRVIIRTISISIPKYPKCGKELPKGNLAFCPFCGSSLEKNETVS